MFIICLAIKIARNLDGKQNSEHSFNQGRNKTGDSLFSIFALKDTNNSDVTQVNELQTKKLKKKKEERSKTMIESEDKFWHYELVRKAEIVY